MEHVMEVAAGSQVVPEVVGDRGGANLEEARRIKIGELVSVLNIIQPYWDRIKREQKILKELYSGEILNSNTYIQCRNAVQQYYNVISSSNDKLSFLLLESGHNKMLQLVRQLDQFEVRMDYAGTLLLRFITGMTTSVQQIDVGLVNAANAKEVAELSSITAPNTDWMQAAESSEIDEAAEIWEDMKLFPKIQEHLCKLEQLIANLTGA